MKDANGNPLYDRGWSGGASSASFGFSDSRQTNFATIGAGTIIIRNGDSAGTAAGLEGLNRDVSKAQYGTMNLGVQLSVDKQTINAIMNPLDTYQDAVEGLNQIAERGRKIEQQTHIVERTGNLFDVGAFGLNTDSNVLNAKFQRMWESEDVQNVLIAYDGERNSTTSYSAYLRNNLFLTYENGELVLGHKEVSLLGNRIEEAMMLPDGYGGLGGGGGRGGSIGSYSLGDAASALFGLGLATGVASVTTDNSYDNRELNRLPSITSEKNSSVPNTLEFPDSGNSIVNRIFDNLKNDGNSTPTVLDTPREQGSIFDGIFNSEHKETVSGKSGKEAAKDVPSWAKGNKPYVGESGKNFAKRLLDEKYGSGNYNTGPGSEFNKIKKWGDRGFK